MPKRIDAYLKQVFSFPRESTLPGSIFKRAFKMEYDDKDVTLSYDVREFLEAVGEALSQHLERVHQDKNRMATIPKEEEGSDESGRVIPGK